MTDSNGPENLKLAENPEENHPESDTVDGAPEAPANPDEANQTIIVKIEDVLTIDPEALEVDLNHGRIGKIENLEPLTKLERCVLSESPAIKTTQG